MLLSGDPLKTDGASELEQGHRAQESEVVERPRGTSLRSLFSFGFSVAASLGSFVFFALQGILLARMLGPADRGVFAAAVLFPQMFLYLGLLGAPELMAGYAAAGMKNAPLRRSAALYGLFAGCGSAILCIVLDVLLIPDSMRHVLPWAILCACTMPLQQIRLSVQAVDHGQRQLNRYNVVRMTAAAMFPVLLACAWLTGFCELRHALIAFVLAQLAALSLAQFGMPQSWIGPRAVSLRKALGEARGLIGAWISTEFLEKLDIVLVMVLIADQATLGLYSAAIPIAGLMIIVPSAAALYTFNSGARADERLAPSQAMRYLLVGLGVQCVCAALLAAALPFLVPWFYGPAFSSTVLFAWLMLPAGVFRGLLLASDSYLRARKKTGIGVSARLIAVPVLLIFSLVGQPWLGVMAIPVALSLAQLTCFAVVARALLADTRLNGPLPKPS